MKSRVAVIVFFLRATSVLLHLTLAVPSSQQLSSVPSRLLIIEEIQEQDMCAFKAFDEYLKDLATATGRSLIIPNRYSFANLSSTSQPWQRCLREHASQSANSTTPPQSKDLHSMLDGSSRLAAGRVVLQKHARWAISQCDPKAHVYVRLSRCRRSAHKKNDSGGASSGCTAHPVGISNCSASQAAADGLRGAHGSSRCLVLNGLVHLQRVLEAAPEFEAEGVGCVTVTHLARGVLVPPPGSLAAPLKRATATRAAPRGGRPTSGRVPIPCSQARWNPLRFSNEWVERADRWLEDQGLRITVARPLLPPLSPPTPPLTSPFSPSLPLPPLFSPPPEKSPSSSNSSSSFLPQTTSDFSASYISAQFRTEKWPQQVASSRDCWRSVAKALMRAAKAEGVSTVFIATDALGSTSKTYSMKGPQKYVARKAFKKEVLAGLEANGFRVVMYPQALIGDRKEASPPAIVDTHPVAAASRQKDTREERSSSIGRRRIRRAPLSHFKPTTDFTDLENDGWTHRIIHNSSSSSPSPSSPPATGELFSPVENASAGGSGNGVGGSDVSEGTTGAEKEDRTRERRVRAIMDLLIASRSKLFLHMYGTFGRGADSLEGCKGARAGSCYGNWIVHTRGFRKRPSAMLSSFATDASSRHAAAEED